MKWRKWFGNYNDDERPSEEGKITPKDIDYDLQDESSEVEEKLGKEKRKKRPKDTDDNDDSDMMPDTSDFEDWWGVERETDSDDHPDGGSMIPV